MKSPVSANQAPWWFVAAVLALLLWSGRSLQDAWTKDLLNLNGLIAFIIWAGGTLLFALRTPTNLRNPSWWTTALLICLAAKFLHLKVLNQAAIAVAVAGILPDFRARIASLAGAAAWTTALGWASIRIFYFNPDPFRIPMATVSIIAIALLCKTNPMPPSRAK
ncbi:MAG: hypothetical protein WCP60_03325 [bacterium]